ncbi:hypothetical protein PGN35_026785 [Nodosilinea sp. PGN35]|uniref:hypothetical protein n=1 Tax=Nodosilinea sp. PGN35 TaxID=3020489 RepID=UPI0023B338E5|nr:hypothetical protein [Nodosilinea sp. TSF1-S3]MDF0365166.1 hypothetical protein [Nodosilinea sp. TSF1-S3]
MEFQENQEHKSKNTSPEKDVGGLEFSEEISYEARLSLLSQRGMAELINTSPQEMAQLAREYYKGDYALKRQKQENEQKIKEAKIQTVRFGLIVFAGIFASVLLYSAFTNNKDFPDRFITLTIGALAGGAGVKIFQEKSLDGK